MYPACKAHAPYYIFICRLSNCTNFFPYYLIKGKTFDKKLLKLMCVLCLSLIFSETLVILTGNKRDMIKNVYWSLCKVPLFLSDFNET